MFNRLWKGFDHAKQQVYNFVNEVIAGDATSPIEGQMWYDSTLQTIKVKGASVIKDLLNRSNHTGTQLSSTISDFDTQVRVSRLDQMATPTASVSMGNQLVTNLATPVSGTDATNKNYVDALINGRQWKDAARVATTANITLSGLLTIDGITLVAWDRVLVKNQTTASANGIYVAASGAWSRSTDADANAEVLSGMTLNVNEGTTQQNSQWTLSTDGTIVVGTTALTFIQTGGSGSYVAGSGMTLTGNTFAIDTAVVTRKYATNIGDGTATSFTITHNLGTLDVQVTVREISTWEQVLVPNKASSTSQCVVEFGVAPASNAYRVIVQG